MSALIEMDKVSFSAQNQDILREVSCVFEEAKTTALAGPPGCGKSSMLKLSAGLLIPSGGAVRFRGKDIVKMNRAENLAFRRETAVVFQDSALWANQDISQILELPLRLHFPRMAPAERKKRIAEVLEVVGYRKKLSIRPSNLSMGEQKLVAFARALVCRPVLLYLDEWTESLDVSGAQRLISLVKEKKELHHTVIFVSHDLRIIRDLADQIIMMQDGQIILNITREEFESNGELARQVEKGIAS
ncbi:hypothetical protein AGMMS49928_00370 [Spirochaetia bacterium]|nr:hypothetical protein AGMMS49928_00370 [Spirochaetia bacterium]